MNCALRTTQSTIKKLFTANKYYINTCKAQFCQKSNEETPEKSIQGGYAKSFNKFQQQLSEEQKQLSEHETFAALFRNSKFIDIGDPSGKIVLGEIFKVVDDDLYIDFGWKFHCVCPRPRGKSNFVRGTKVRVLVNDLELSSKFLGYDRDITLLEAEAALLGPAHDHPAAHR